MKRSKALRIDHATMRAILTVALMGFGAAHCRMEEASAVRSAASTGRYGISPSVGLLLPQEFCEETGGSWHSRLVRCDCTEGAVFIVNRGCTNLARAPWLKLQQMGTDSLAGQIDILQQDKGIFEITVDFENVTASEREAIGRLWLTTPSELLRGLTLPGTEPAAMLHVHVHRPSNGSLLTLVSEMPMHEGIEMAMHTIDRDFKPEVQRPSYA